MKLPLDSHLMYPSFTLCFVYIVESNWNMLLHSLDTNIESCIKNEQNYTRTYNLTGRESALVFNLLLTKVETQAK